MCKIPLTCPYSQENCVRLEASSDVVGVEVVNCKIGARYAGTMHPPSSSPALHSSNIYQTQTCWWPFSTRRVEKEKATTETPKAAMGAPILEDHKIKTLSWKSGSLSWKLGLLSWKLGLLSWKPEQLLQALQEFSQRNLPAFIAFAARLSFLG